MRQHFLRDRALEELQRLRDKYAMAALKTSPRYQTDPEFTPAALPRHTDPEHSPAGAEAANGARTVPFPWELLDDQLPKPPYGLENPVIEHLICQWSDDETKVSVRQTSFVAIAAETRQVLTLHACTRNASWFLFGFTDSVDTFESGCTKLPSRAARRRCDPISPPACNSQS